ncbi:MAG TPA: choice-of-anchor D domain-containing protein, partial [Acidobacteriaceae bacterium]|nr:choice-of-anchor D domain-containing protein [Acidobacteriaceae bacterium]
MNRLRALVLLCIASVSSYAAPIQGASTARIVERGLPILFEPSPGQAAEPITMVGRLPGVAAGFGPSIVALRLQTEKPTELTITFTGARAVIPEGEELQKSQSNYLLGNDARLWRTHVPNYGRVSYRGLYPGVDAVFYGRGQLLEHDFVVAPGADYRQVRMHLSKNARATIDKDGGIAIEIAGTELFMHKPLIYQNGGQNAGARQTRTGSFQLLANGDIGFRVGNYDRSRALVIDPVLSFSTYLSPTAEGVGSVASDSSGNSYLTGGAVLGFPVTPGSFPGCGTCTAGQLVTYVSKLGVDGKSLIYSTLIGGAGTQSYAIAVDTNGNALVVGETPSSDFPTKNGQPIGAPGDDYGFLVSLSADGSSLNYGTLLGGEPSPGKAGESIVTAIALDNAGNAYITGNTISPFFPTTPGAVNNGIPAYTRSQNFLTKFSPSGTLIYGAMLGDPDPQNGGGGPIGAFAVTVDSSGDAFVAGEAGTLWPTTSGAYLRQIPGAQPYASPFVTEVAPDGGSILYSTFLDYASQVIGIAVLPNGNVFVAGSAGGFTYPTTPNAYQQSSTGGKAFLTELNSTGSARVYATLFGDPGFNLLGFTMDPDGDLWLAGQTGSAQFPLVSPLQSTVPLGSTSTLSQFDPTGTTLKFSTFLGGTSIGLATGVSVDANHRAHVTGATGFGLYTTPGAYLAQVPNSNPGAVYAYAALVDTSVAAPALCLKPNGQLNWGSVVAGTSQDISVTLTNCGTLPLNVTNVVAGSSVFTVPPAENECSQTIPAGQSCTLAVRYSPTTQETDASTLTFTSNASVTQAVLPLSGSGIVATLVVENAPQFDYTLVGQTSQPIRLVIQNKGGAPLTINLANSKISGDFSLQGLGGCSVSMQTNQGCGLLVYFTPTAPGSRSGTLEIASNDPVHPLVSVPLQGTGYTGSPVPEITTLSSQLVLAGVGETEFLVQGFGFSPTSIVQLNGVAQQTTYMSASILKANLSASSLPANAYGEMAVTVVTPAPGGGQSAPYVLTQYQSVAIQAAFLLNEPVGKMLYASIPAAATSNPNTVVPINPATAMAGTPITVGNNPGVLAVSSDGAYLYVALDADHAIQRINLATLAVERTFALPVDPEFGQLQVTDMHVVPGAPTEVVVSLAIPYGGPPEDGAALFNDAGLVNWLPGVMTQSNIDIDRFTFTNPNTIYALTPYDGAGLDELTLDATGLHLSGSAGCCVPAPGYVNVGAGVVSDGTLLYTTLGQVWNPVANQLISTYAVPSGRAMDTVISDTSSGKTYFFNTGGLYDSYTALSILAFDQKSSAETASLSLSAFSPSAPYTGTQLVRWGANGFALRALAAPATLSNAVVLFTSSIAGSSNLNPVPVAGSLSPASTPAGGADFTLTITGSNFISGSTVEWNGSPRLTAVVSPTRLTATIYASDIASMGTAQVTVVSPGNGAGASAALPFTISAGLPPPPPAAPVVTLSPSSLTFTAQAITTTSAAQSVTLSNAGNADLTGISISIGGANAASFAETNNCGTAVGAGKSCTISATFTPGSAGAFSATVNITDNAASSPQSVQLSGTGSTTTFVIAPQSG